MNRSLSTIAAVSLLLFTAACREPIIRGKGPSTTEQRTVSGFYNKVRIDASVDANIMIGATPSISIQGQTNLLPYIETKVEDSTLIIMMKDGDYHFYSKEAMVATITMPALVGIENSGSSDITIKGNVTGQSLKVDLSGSGDISAEAINVTDLDVDISGSSDVNIATGTATKATYSVSGSGSISAFGLQTTESSIHVAGSGDAEVNASSKLQVEVAGSGDVSYKGHPAVTQSIAGSGSVSDAN